MALLDHNGESEFPFNKDKVFDALCSAIPRIKGMKVETADKLLGRVMVKAGVSLASWGENIPIQLTTITEDRTKIQITSSPKTGIMLGGAFDMGKNRQNIEQILLMTSKILSSPQSVTQNAQTQSQTTFQNQNVQDAEQKWYDRNWLAILLCFVFFPVGLYALWKNRNLAKGWKIGITTLIALAVIGNIGDKNAKSPSVNSSEKTTKLAEEQKVDYKKIGDGIEVGDFIYRVDGVQFKKSLGNEYVSETADGIFLLVPLSIKNVSKEGHTLDNSMFKLTDEHGTEYESSNRGTTAVEMSGGKTLFLKQCQPNIQTSGVLVFEVPSKGVYDLKLSGGFWSGRTAAVKLTN